MPQSGVLSGHLLAGTRQVKVMPLQILLRLSCFVAEDRKSAVDYAEITASRSKLYFQIVDRGFDLFPLLFELGNYNRIGYAIAWLM